jgi:uncharacterized protein with PIN domain
LGLHTKMPKIEGKRMWGGKFLEECPQCSGELKYLEGLIVQDERFDWVECEDCGGVYGLRWLYNGWKRSASPSGKPLVRDAEAVEAEVWP